MAIELENFWAAPPGADEAQPEFFGFCAAFRDLVNSKIKRRKSLLPELSQFRESRFGAPMSRIRERRAENRFLELD